MPELISGYRYEVMDDDTFDPLFAEYRPLVFANTATFNPRAHYSEEELGRLDTLSRNLDERYHVHFAIYNGDTFVGWHTGRQADAGIFYMVNTGILQEHRGRGLYTALLPVVLEHLKHAGFQIVTSRHNMTNNAVIIPKLKAGFIISGFEVNDSFGTLVQLSYYFNPLRRKMMDVRVGQRKLDDETRGFF